MIRAIYRPRQDDVLLLADADPDRSIAIPRHDIDRTIAAIRKAGDVPANAESLTRPTETAWSAR